MTHLWDLDSRLVQQVVVDILKPNEGLKSIIIPLHVTNGSTDAAANKPKRRQVEIGCDAGPWAEGSVSGGGIGCTCSMLLVSAAPGGTSLRFSTTLNSPRTYI